MPRDVRILGTGQLLELQRRLRAAGGENVRRSMQRRIRAAAEPLRDDLRHTVRALPIRGQGRGKSSGPSPTTRPLRATIAGAIRISVRTTGTPGARVWVDKSRLPADMRALPERTDEGRWRHPVFGNRRRWATQYAAPWWGVTIRRHEPRMRAQVARVVEDIKRRLGG